MDAGVLLNPLLPDKHKDDVLQNRAYLLLAEVHAIHAKQELSECNYEQFSFIRWSIEKLGVEYWFKEGLHVLAFYKELCGSVVVEY